MSFLSDLRLSPVGLGGRLHHAMARDYRTIHRRYPEGPEDPLLAASLGRAGWFLGVGPSGDPLLPQRTICHISAPALAVTLADHQRLILPTKTLVLGFRTCCS